MIEPTHEAVPAAPPAAPELVLHSIRLPARPLGVGGIVTVVGAVLLLFALSVALRTPWRGHLARGDQWVTAQTLRFVRTWYRDGVGKHLLALVASPPTSEFGGRKKEVKWGLPGNALLVHGTLQALDLEPTVERVMLVNLGLHLVLALTLAALAYLLARLTWPERPLRWTLAGIHCGAFVLLYPAILYWGQSLSCTDFTMLPLFVFVVAARWLRGMVQSRRGRTALDLAVVAGVVLGTITDFLFWLLVPYLIVTRRRAERRGLPHTTDPWRWTLATPFAVTMVLLGVVFAVQGRLLFAAGRAGSWTGGEGGGAPGLIHLYGAAVFLGSHFSDAFSLVGAVALVLGAWKLWPRDAVPGVPPVVRGILLDLLLPCVLVTLVLARHSAAHTFAAVKFAPFVALAWTFFAPLVLERAARPRRWLAGAYLVVAALAIFPPSSNYRQFFPEPEPRWETQGTLLRESTNTWDTVYSPTIEIDLLPPQPIALAERRVAQVYGPLDISMGPLAVPAVTPDFRWTSDINQNQPIAYLGPEELVRTFGATGPQVARDDLRLVRYPLGQVLSLLAARPDAAAREHLLDVLTGELRRAPQEPAPRPLPPRLDRPVALHIVQDVGGWLRYDRLYWVNEERYHWRAYDSEFVVLGESRLAKIWAGMWTPVTAVDEGPRAWGRFVPAAFHRARDAAAAGRATRLAWRGYDVVRVPVDEVPPPVRAATPAVSRWDAYVVSKGPMPIALALGPAELAAGRSESKWVVVVFDDLAVDIRARGDIQGEWRIRYADGAES